MSSPAALNPDALVERLRKPVRFVQITSLDREARYDPLRQEAADELEARATLITELQAKVAIWEMDTWIAEAESYLSALAAPSAVAGDGLVERLQRPWDGSSGSRDRRDAERREAATLITELQAKVARMEVEAFDAAIAHGKTKLALAKSEASREAAEARVAEAGKVISTARNLLWDDSSTAAFKVLDAALPAPSTWMEGGR